MNIYSRKQTWKIILFVIAALIFGLSLVYTNLLVQRIEQEERDKARLWAEAIQEKADLVKYTQELFDKLKVEERKKGRLWASGIKQLMNVNNDQDLTFIFEVVKDNESIPVILTDETGRMINSRNVDTSIINYESRVQEEILAMGELYPPIEISISNRTKNYLYYRDSRLFTELRQVMDDIIKSFISEVVINSASVPVIYVDSTQQYIIEHNIRDFGKTNSLPGNIVKSESLIETLNQMKSQNEPIRVELSDGQVNYIFYQESFLLKQLRYYPFVQFSVIGIFLIAAYVLFSISRRAEQNQVWVGMSKETAHQLGTPISSMMAWMELLKAKYGENDPTIDEILNDVGRLETIADRFSKVGSAPKLESYDLEHVVKEAVSYLQKRVSKRVDFVIQPPEEKITALLNVPLFEWVVENVTKNAVDAMEGYGRITISISKKGDKAILDITDTGKGLPKSKFKRIFQPGYTTKKRGWGLGLTLVKRIVENYHNGKIFVKQSDPQNGTTFRIILTV